MFIRYNNSIRRIPGLYPDQNPVNPFSRMPFSRSSVGVPSGGSLCDRIIKMPLFQYFFYLSNEQPVQGWYADIHDKEKQRNEKEEDLVIRRSCCTGKACIVRTNEKEKDFTEHFHFSLNDIIKVQIAIVSPKSDRFP